MDRLVANILPPSRAGALEVRLVGGILSLTSPTAGDWPYGLDLGARVVMDFDRDGCLRNLDLLIPPARWQQGEIALPGTRIKGSLALNVMPLQRSSYALPIEAISPAAGQLLLHWGPTQASSCVLLSKQVTALMAGTLWVGLYITGF
ncbi:MAG TPA: hypothetical protein V6D23_04575 [Candidatus Obscuribacterales bacterium]